LLPVLFRYFCASEEVEQKKEEEKEFA